MGISILLVIHHFLGFQDLLHNLVHPVVLYSMNSLLSDTLTYWPTDPSTPIGPGGPGWPTGSGIGPVKSFNGPLPPSPMSWYTSYGHIKHYKPSWNWVLSSPTWEYNTAPGGPGSPGYPMGPDTPDIPFRKAQWTINNEIHSMLSLTGSPGRPSYPLGPWAP